MSQGTNFIALKATVSEGTTVKLKFNNKTTTLDSDGIIVIQMTEAKKALSAVFEATDATGDKNSVEVKLSGLTLSAEQENTMAKIIKNDDKKKKSTKSGK